jgi:hypothetical protein
MKVKISEAIAKKMLESVDNELKEEYIDTELNLTDMSQKEINEILRGYIEAALSTEEDQLKNDATMDFDEEDVEDMDEIEKIITLQGKFERKSFTSFTSEDIDFDSVIEAYKDIKKFIRNAGDEAVQEAIEENDLFRLGMDIWLTRNGHGSGFFGHNYDNEKILIKAAKDLGTKDLYVGDNMRLYFS